MNALWNMRSVCALAAIVSIGCATRQSTSPQPDPSPQATPPAPTVNQSAPGTIPVGQEIDVRLRTTLSSETATVEQRFEATTVADLLQDGRVLVPAGSVVHGVVSAVEKAGRVDRDASLTLTFDRLVVNGREHDLRASATQVFESGGLRDEAPRAGVGAGVGGVVGGIIGGVRGAILGAVIGAGGAVVATEGKDVTLPAGSIIRIRVDSPVNVR